MKTKKQIFNGMIFANILDIGHYVLLGAFSGCSTKIMALIRNIFIIRKESNKNLNKYIYLILFVIAYVVLAVLSYANIYSTFPFAAAIIYMIVVWNGDELNIKRIAFLCYFLWLIYNISIFSIMGIISNMISLISTFIAYYKHRQGIHTKINWQ